MGVAAGEPGREYGFSDLARQAQDGLTAAMARGGNRVEFVTPVAPPTLGAGGRTIRHSSRA